MSARAELGTRIYNSLVAFNSVACWDSLRLAQMRQYLAEHLANDLVPSWVQEGKAQSAREEIAHVLLMVGLFPDDWLNAHRAEVLHETPLYLAEFDSVPSEVHSTLGDARAWCDDIAKSVGNGSCWDWSRNEDGVYVQFWTHEDDDRPLHLTGGTVTEIRVQHPDNEEKAAPEGEATPDFFQPGRTYTSSVWKFRCEAITPSPTTGELRALGWQLSPVNGTHLWHAIALDPDDWTHGGWTDTEAGAR